MKSAEAPEACIKDVSATEQTIGREFTRRVANSDLMNFDSLFRVHSRQSRIRVISIISGVVLRFLAL
jgi:hypothetical protein